MLENLIGNALKFTGPGGTITVGASSGNGEVIMWVEDSGAGIAPDELPHVFDRFWQARKVERRGTGLGLTITKAIVESHGGRIWLDSRLGQGTTARFTIPASVDLPASEDRAIATLLLVDDRPENLIALKAILDRPEYRLVTASSGEEALKLALRQQFDVALIDVAMPVMNGLDVAAHLKQLERSRETPVIFITAYGDDPEQIHRAYAAGGADYLIKPLDAEIVRKKVAVFVGLSRRRQAHASESAASSEDAMAMETAEPTNGTDRNGSLPPAGPGELPELLRVLAAVRDGDFSVRVPDDWIGLLGKIGDSVNDIIKANQQMADQLERVGQVVGKEGRTRQRVRFPRSIGSWAAMETSVNTLIEDLLWPTTEVTRSLDAVAQGDLSQTMRLDVDGRPLQGEFLRSSTIVNSMIKQLQVFTSEVTRVAREVGTDGKLGGQAEVPDVSGVWKDLTDSVNSMASNLTGQVRNISRGDHRRGQRRSVEEDHRRRPGRDPAAERGHQHHGRSAARLRQRGDPRGPRGRHRGQAGRPGDRPRRGRHLEGPHRLGERHVRQPDRPGPQHRPRHHRRRPRRPVAEDHRRRPGRDPGAEGHHQHDGRPAELVRQRGHPRRPRGRHRGPPGRSGAGAGCGRHLEGPHRQRQLHGQQPDGSGAQHRRGRDGHRQRRPVARRSPSTSAARSCS